MIRKHMIQALRISDSGFAKWRVKPVAKRGRNTYYWLRDVIENRVRAKRCELGCCEECGYPKEGLVGRNTNWNDFCPECNHPINADELFSSQAFWEKS